MSRNIVARFCAAVLTLALPAALLVPAAFARADDVSPPTIIDLSIARGDGLVVPLVDAAVNGCTPSIVVRYEVQNASLDAASSYADVDGTAWPCTYAADGVAHFEPPGRLSEGPHVATVRLTDTAGRSAMSDPVPFVVTAPNVSLRITGVHWYPDWESDPLAEGPVLHVEAEFANTGSGLAWEVPLVPDASAGVRYVGRCADGDDDYWFFSPSICNELLPGERRTVQMVFTVPDRVRSFGLTCDGAALDNGRNGYPLFMPKGKRLVTPWQGRIRVPRGQAPYPQS